MMPLSTVLSSQLIRNQYLMKILQPQKKFNRINSYLYLFGLITFFTHVLRMFDRWGVINVRQTELCIIKLQQNHHTNKSEPTVVRIAPSPTPSWQTLDRRFIQDRRYSSTKPIYDKIKRLIKPRSTSIQPERSQCGIRCDCKTQKKHGYLAEGKRTGTDGYRGKKRKKTNNHFVSYQKLWLDNEASSKAPSSFSCACRGAPLWCQSWKSGFQLNAHSQ